MCGIMGYVRTRKAIAPRRQVLDALMAGIESRGAHASGVAAMNDKSIVWAKQPIPSRQFIKGEWWEKALKLNPQLLVGHARFATHGSAKDNANNHPHISEDNRWMIVHNGIILEDPKGIKCKGLCDSEIILRMLERDGIDDTVNAMQSWATSWYSVLAIDTKEKILYAWRDSRTPLVIADLSKEIGGMIFCSTRGILEEAIEKAGIKKNTVKVYSFRPAMIYSFPLGCDAGLINLDLPLAENDWLGDWKRKTKTEARKDRKRMKGLVNSRDIGNWLKDLNESEMVALNKPSWIDYYKDGNYPGTKREGV
jgi:glucosamine--fructose-6-phosphate aminotransferase (isomerizing)